MRVSELIIKLRSMPLDARVVMGYDGNYVSVEPSGEVFVVHPTDDRLYAKAGDVFIEGKA